jgi:uncharacterized membrane protein/predicted aspartyl protease
MESFIQGTLLVHILVGSTALLAGAMAIFSQKGKALHRRAGHLYFWAMTLVFVTGIVVAGYRSNRFLFLIAFLSYYSVFAGVRFLQLKQLHRQQQPKWHDWAAGMTNAVANMVFVGMGMYYLWEGARNPAGAWLSIGFGMGGLLISYANLKPFVVRPRQPYHWYLAHIGNMMGGYIATLTAFLSTLVTRFELMNPFLAFALPSLIGIPLLLFWQRKVESSFTKSPNRTAANAVLILACCLGTSCSYLKNVKLLSGGEIKREHYVQTLPFEWVKGLIVVKARLHSDTTLREFIFDTGAFDCKVESSLASALELEVVAEKTNSTAQGISQKIQVVRIDSLRLGETTIYDIGAGKLTYAPTSASPCVAGSGLIGANLIKLAHWKIDYEKQELHFSDTPFEVEEGCHLLPFEHPVLSGTPKISIEVEGVAVENILLDVGYNGGLVLPLSIAHHFDAHPSKVILDESTSGIYGTNADSLLVKQLEVSVGGAKANIPVEFSSLNKALLGNEFLKHFTVYIDYDAKQICLRPQKEVSIDAPRHFLVAMLSDSLWVVSRTAPELPLRLGDTLATVNGLRPKEAFGSHCDYFMGIGKILRGDTLRVVTQGGDTLSIRQ